jgi:hypothetical protein
MENEDQKYYYFVMSLYRNKKEPKTPHTCVEYFSPDLDTARTYFDNFTFKNSLSWTRIGTYLIKTTAEHEFPDGLINEECLAEQRV